MEYPWLRNKHHTAQHPGDAAGNLSRFRGIRFCWVAGWHCAQAVILSSISSVNAFELTSAESGPQSRRDGSDRRALLDTRGRDLFNQAGSARESLSHGRPAIGEGDSAGSGGHRAVQGERREQTNRDGRPTGNFCNAGLCNEGHRPRGSGQAARACSGPSWARRWSP